MKAVVLGLFCVALAACASPTITATPTPAIAPSATAAVAPSPAASAVPSPIPSLTVVCGPIAADSCAKAVAAAMRLSYLIHPPVLAVRIELPTALMTCPPGGGPALGMRTCALIVDIATSAGETIVPLIRTGDGWMPSALVR